MSDVNIVILQGRLTHNPELRKTPSGVAVTDLNIASNRFVRRKDADTKKTESEKYDKYTTFTRVTLWNQMAERYVAQLHRGDMVIIEGQLVDDSYEKDGVKHNGRLKVDNVQRVNVLAKATPKTEGGTTSEPEVPQA